MMLETEQDVDTGRSTFATFFLSVSLICVCWIFLILLVHSHNNRLLPSWHGFLHTAIANRFPTQHIPPENPFFAEERLPYYWFYQYAGYQVSRFLGIDVLHAFQLIALSSLVVIVWMGGWTGLRNARSLSAGLLIGYLALTGANPMGPAIAASKYLIKGMAVWDDSARQSNIETIFVSNQAADNWMTQPLLPTLHISSEWWHGQNLIWFFDISSRATALAFVTVLLFFLTGENFRLSRRVAISIIIALITAFNPISGFAVAASLVCAHGILNLFAVKKTSLLKASTIPAVALVVGLVLALPFYFHILLTNTGSLHITPTIRYAVLKMMAISGNYFLLAPLSVVGAWKADPENKMNLKTIALAGILLLIAVPLIVVWPHNEHNLTNPALILLAVPAAIWVARTKSLKFLTVIIAVFLPTTACTILANCYRPAIPIAYYDRGIHRTPRDGPLEMLYEWIRNQTPYNSVFVIDPDRPVKMSGNVSELPAFSARTLFVDQSSYLTVPYKEEGLRREIARKIVSGAELTASQEVSVRKLDRPVYVVIYVAQDTGLLQRLQQRYGRPLFQKDYVAVFRLQGALDTPYRQEVFFRKTVRSVAATSFPCAFQCGPSL